MRNGKVANDRRCESNQKDVSARHPLYRYDASQSQVFLEVVENINYVSASFTAVKLNIMHE